jgi:hypothetical protein
MRQPTPPHRKEGRVTEAEQFRAELQATMVEALWTELERQHDSDNMDAPYVDRDMDIIDGEINMSALATTAIDTVLSAMSPPF